jgi:pimeloyl-ACP methyl ester carboxylesterase
MVRLAVVAGAAAFSVWAAVGAAASPASTFVPVRFAAGDGTELRGETVGRGPVGIVIAHDADASYGEWEPGAKFLGAHGYRVLLFDYAINPFLSQSAQHRQGTFRYDRDLVGAAAYLRRTGAKTIVLAGDGIGGLAALAAARELGRSVARTFVLTAGGITGQTDTLGDPGNPDDLNGLVAARGLETPLLVLAAKSDTNAGPLYRAAGAQIKREVTLPDAALKANGFGLAMWSSGAAWARSARAAVLAFLRPA